MDQRFHLAKNKSSKFTLLKHAYSTRLKCNKHAKMSAILIVVAPFNLHKLVENLSSLKSIFLWSFITKIF